LQILYFDFENELFVYFDMTVFYDYEVIPAAG